MRVRRLDKNNDMTFGSGNLDFIKDNVDCVAQNIFTSLKLCVGDWFWDRSKGVDWFGKCLGKNTPNEASGEIKRTITSVPGVTNVTDLNILVDGSKRQVQITCKVETIYGGKDLDYKISTYIGD